MPIWAPPEAFLRMLVNVHKENPVVFVCRFIFSIGSRFCCDMLSRIFVLVLTIISGEACLSSLSSGGCRKMCRKPNIVCRRACSSNYQLQPQPFYRQQQEQRSFYQQQPFYQQPAVYHRSQTPHYPQPQPSHLRQTPCPGRKDCLVSDDFHGTTSGGKILTTVGYGGQVELGRSDDDIEFSIYGDGEEFKTTPTSEKMTDSTDETELTDEFTTDTSNSGVTKPMELEEDGQTGNGNVGKDDQNVPCKFLTCDFEDGSLCLYLNEALEKPAIAAIVATKRGTKPHGNESDFWRKYHRRSRRETTVDTDFASLKPWVTWMGRFGNRVTGIEQAAEGSTYAAAYLKPGQVAILQSDILYSTSRTLTFRAYEATEDVALRLCCESLQNCQWETSAEAEFSSRKWRTVQSKCPVGTKKIVFVCQNTGKYQGACGLDDITVDGDQCDQVEGPPQEEYVDPFRKL